MLGVAPPPRNRGFITTEGVAAPPASNRGMPKLKNPTCFQLYVCKDESTAAQGKPMHTGATNSYVQRTPENSMAFT